LIVAVNHCLANHESARKCTLLRLNGLIHGNDVSTVRYIGRCLSVQPGADILQTLNIYRQVRSEANLVIIIDEFDVFCRKNQLLLYNFFDLLQYVRHMLVIGLTARYDCIELLEKRVKSRMNHKIVNLVSPYQNFGDYLHFAEQLLPSDIPLTDAIRDRLEWQYSKSYSIRGLKMCLLQAICESQPECSSPDKRKKRTVGVGTTQLLPLTVPGVQVDSKIQVVKGLSHVELCVLLLAAKLVYRKEKEQFNCGGLSGLLHEVPSQISINKRLLYTAVGALLDYDLLLIENAGNRGASASNQLHLTEWTPLLLNVGEEQVTKAIKEMDSQLMHSVKHLIELQT
jgi:hypothetical protein